MSILFDFDGVLCSLDRAKSLEIISTAISSLTISPSQLLDNFFFTNPFYREIDEGKISYFEMLQRIQQECWSGSKTDWMNLWKDVWNCYVIDQAIMLALVQLHSKGFTVRIVTDNHKDFREWFCSRVELRRFEPILVCSAELGIRKPSKGFFEAALPSSGFKFEKACLIDDSLVNVRAAAMFGITPIHHVLAKHSLTKLSRFTGIKLT